MSARQSTSKTLISASIALLLLAAAAVGLTLSASGDNSATVQQISSDPYTNSTSQHHTEVEPDLYAFGNTAVAAFQAGRFFSGGGSSNIGWATSTDGGTTWASGFLPSLTVFATPAGQAARATDPAVTFDRNSGTWLIATLVCAAPPDTCDSAPNSVAVSRSPDGINWGPPVNVNTGDDDKEWVACDNSLTSPFLGRCYVSWNDIGNGRTLTSVSTDGGLTWGVGVPSIQMSGVQPLVQPNGTLIIAGDGGSGIVAIRSTNGGVTYSQPQLVASLNSHSPTGMRAPALPSGAMDGAGNVFLAWADCRFRASCSANDIVMSTSADGITWSATPSRIPIDSAVSGVDHFIPGLGIDPLSAGGSARLGLSYYFLPTASCAVNACQLDVGFISSDNGGATWSSAIQLNAQPMSLSWLTNTDWPGRMVGDYISTESANGHFLSVFALASAPTGSTFNEAMSVAMVSAGTPTPTPSPSPSPTPIPCINPNPPWPVPPGDSDCDGFTDSQEMFIGTNPHLACGSNAWPLDLDDNHAINIADLSFYVGTINSAPPGPPYSQRLDLDGNHTIDVVDLSFFVGMINETCTP